ncbi:MULTISPECIES: nuclear transport factor 2 family protein [unclassified Burkholderia]|nr:MULTISPECIES: nuclear transport factor 2 family protein [unclassified Burkholderia]
MLANDVEALDALLDDDLVFTVPTGQVISKEDDLAAHRVKLLRLDTLDVIEMRASAVDEMILTTTRAALAGRFDGAAFTGTFAYTRLWRRSGAHWRVVAGHASQVI